MAGAIYSLDDATRAIGDWLFAPLAGHPDGELVVVMVCAFKPPPRGAAHVTRSGDSPYSLRTRRSPRS